MKIVMEHPDLGPERRETVNPDQFELAWAPVGWVEVDRIYETFDAEFVPTPPTVYLPSWDAKDADLEEKVDKKGNVTKAAAVIIGTDASLPPEPTKKSSKKSG